MAKSTDLSCPSCGAELSVEALFAHELDRQAFARLCVMSLPLGARVVKYLALFAPAKNRMTLARKARLIEELLPDLQRQAITRNGRDWEAPLSAWSIAIDGMLSLRDQGKLTLPLTSHGYLYSVLAGLADKAERTAENERELQRQLRTPAGRATGSADIGSVLDGMLGDAPDAGMPAADASAPAAPPTQPLQPAAPRMPPPKPAMSPLVREMLAQVRKREVPPPTTTPQEDS